jgi:hypothetical protein
MAAGAPEYNTSPESDGQRSPIPKEAAEEKAFTKDPSLDRAPDGGLRAWLVAIGTACTFFAALGFSNAFGVFQQYYITHQLRDQSPDKVAWIGSISAFLQFAASAIGGPLFDRYGAWVGLFPWNDDMSLSLLTV